MAQVLVFRVSLCFLSLALFSGCSLWQPKVDMSKAQATRLSRTPVQKQDLSEIHKKIEAQEFQQALSLIDKFEQTHLRSPFVFEAQIKRADALYGLGQVDEAKVLYRNVVQATRSLHAEIPGMALLRLGWLHEQEGDLVLALANYQDAEAFKGLDPWLLEVEIPQRQATVLTRLGRDEDSISYMQKAEMGLNRLKNLPQFAKQVPEARFRLAALPDVSQMPVEESLRVMKLISRFQVQVIEEGLEPFAGRVFRDLMQSYRRVISQIESPRDQLNPSLEQQSRQYSMVLQSLEQLRAQILPSAAPSALQTNLVDYIDGARSVLFAKIFKSSDFIPLSPEARPRGQRPPRQLPKKN